MKRLTFRARIKTKIFDIFILILQFLLKVDGFPPDEVGKQNYI